MAYISHVTEDVDKISHPFYDEKLLGQEPFGKDGPFIHRGLHSSRAAGKKRPHVPKERAHLYSVQGRLETFQAEEEEWEGPSALEMADAGFVFKDKREAKCVFCPLACRFPKPTIDPLQYHQDFSPNCAYLRMLRENGVKPNAEGGRKRRRHSYSSYHVLRHRREE